MFRKLFHKLWTKHTSNILLKNPKRFRFTEASIMEDPELLEGLEEMRIVWIDLEMTGLDPQKDHILEIACVITDANLMVLDQHQNVIHQSEKVLSNMGDWCQKQHAKSGLIEDVRKSQVTLAEAEKQTLDFMKQYTMPQFSPLAGNTVYMDKFFLMKHMPQVVDHLHYRIIDVSTVKEICRRWSPGVARQGAVKKKGIHRALQDVHESIDELRLYKRRFFSCKVNELYKTSI